MPYLVHLNAGRTAATVHRTTCARAKNWWMKPTYKRWAEADLKAEAVDLAWKRTTRNIVKCGTCRP